MKRKGEITSTQLTGIIILIVSFAVILLFYLNLNWGENVDRETCKQSVILKASSPEVADIRILPVTLKCKTEKICITTNRFSKGDCEEDFGKDYTTIKVSE